MALVIDGSGDITGLTTGALEATAIGTGAIRQVVSSPFTNTISTTSTSFVTTGWSASITPSSSSSRILILFGCRAKNASATGVQFAFYRGATNITGSTGYVVYGSSADFFPYLSYVDSPSTTNSTTYTVYYCATGSGTASIQTNGSPDFPAFLTLMEIAG